MPLFTPWVTAAGMRELEGQAIAAGRSEGQLMEEAGAGIAAVVRRWLPQPGALVVFAGKGHNAGDAFVVARYLAEAGWRVQVRLAWPEAELKPLAARQWAALRGHGAVTEAEVDAPEIPPGRPLLLVDGLLGIGTTGGALRGRAGSAVRALNQMRIKEHALTLAVDQPSGLEDPSGAVVADFTVTAGFPKVDLLTDRAAAVTGRLAWVPLTGLASPDKAAERGGLVSAAGLRRRLAARPAFSRHKGQSGRIGLLAGSTGLTGAARLTATAAALMGGGLVTLFCPRHLYEILAATCPPEVMVRPVASCQEIRDFPLDALGLGPGMGQVPPPLWDALLHDDPRPAVVDADALNLLAQQAAAHPGRAGRFAGPRLLTPHPGELARLTGALAPHLAAAPRLAQATALADRLGATVLAKSARSLVVAPGLPPVWNGTGHPLMARGGMGDVLTGFLTVFLAQGMSGYDAAALGSWLLGRGAELYHTATGWEEPALASEVMRYATGPAMAELREGTAL